MHGPLDKQPQDEQSNYQSFSIKLIALPVLVIVALIGMLVSHPAAIKWISGAVQAEFAGTDMVPDVVPPTRFAQPSNAVQTAKTN